MTRWLLMLICLKAASSYAEQRFAMEPQDQTAVVGSRVTLPCRVIDKSGMLQWTKDDFGLGTHRNLSGFERYSMVGSDEEGDFSLDVYPVMLEDDARYQCQVSPSPTGDPGIRSQYATLSVLVPPEAPKISQGSVQKTTEDREIELECISAAGKPAAEITWIDGNGNVMTKNVENIMEKLPDERRFTVRSILKLTPKRAHHNTTFTCQAQNTAERTHRVATIKLEVKYAPKVSVKILSGLTPNGRILEGTEVHFGCSADGNPSEMTYRWFLNDTPVPGDFTNEMVIHNVTREHHDSIVKCQVQNIVGKSEESETLDVTYAPVFRTKPQSVQAESGSTVVLSCNVDSNPPADITWIHENSTPTLAHRTNKMEMSSEKYNYKRGSDDRHFSSNLTITVDDRTAGRYFCRASVPGFPDIGADASVYLKGPPTIVSHKTQFGVEGDNVRVECVAFSIPKPDHIIWSFNGRDIDVNDQDYSILEDPLPEGVKSTLIIRESQQKHFGMYNCSVVNPYGNDVVAISLMPQKNFPMILLVTGFIFGVVVIIIVIMFVFLCQRQNKKPPNNIDSNTIEKQTQQSDRSSNISDLKLDFRTGSSVSNMDNNRDSDAGSEATTRVGVPLAGPIPLSIGEYRYSGEYVEPNFPPKLDGQNNNGYVSFVDYARDYNPPPPLLQPTTLESSRESLISSRLHMNSNSLINSFHQNQAAQQNAYSNPIVPLKDLNPSYHLGNGGIDPRYNATYGNPYLRSNNVGLPPPNTAVLAATPAPPPYTRDASRGGHLANHTSNSIAVPQSASATTTTAQLIRLANTPNGAHIITNNNLTAQLKRSGTLATHV